MTPTDVTTRGNWRREFFDPNEYWPRPRRIFRYYYRGIRVPWILWAMFS